MTEPNRPDASRKCPPSYKWELLGLLCLAFFFHQGDRAIYGVVEESIKTDLHLSDAQIGLVGAILFWMIAVMTPVAGYLGDMLRKKTMITGALIFWSLTTALTGLSTGFWSLAALRSVATGGSESLYAPPAYSLLARFHRRTRSLAMSVHQAALYIGVMTSGLIGGGIAYLWGWRAVFCVYGGIGVVIGLIFIVRLKDDRDYPEEETAGQPAPRPKWENPLRSLSLIFRTPTSALLTVGFTAVVFVNNAYVVFAPSFLRENSDLSKFWAGTLAMFLHHFAAMIGVLIGGPLSDRLSMRIPGARLRLQTASMFLGGLSILYMGMGPTVVAVCVGMTVFGLFRGLYECNTHASLFEVIEPRYRSSAVGAMVMAAFLVGATAPWLMGIFGDAGYTKANVFAGYSIAYFIGSLAVGTALVVFYRRDRIAEAEAIASGQEE